MSDICTTPMCENGAASVQEMQSVWMSLPDNQRTYFQTAVQSVLDSFNQNYSWYSEWIPFNTACCTVEQIGQQADRLTQQMLAAMGRAGSGSGPATSGQGMSLTSLLVLGGLGYLALVYWSGHR